MMLCAWQKTLKISFAGCYMAKAKIEQATHFAKLNIGVLVRNCIDSIANTLE